MENQDCHFCPEVTKPPPCDISGGHMERSNEGLLHPLAGRNQWRASEDPGLSHPSGNNEDFPHLGCQWKLSGKCRFLPPVNHDMASSPFSATGCQRKSSNTEGYVRFRDSSHGTPENPSFNRKSLVISRTRKIAS